MSNGTSWDRISDLPICSTAPITTVPPRLTKSIPTQFCTIRHLVFLTDYHISEFLQADRNYVLTFHVSPAAKSSTSKLLNSCLPEMPVSTYSAIHGESFVYVEYFHTCSPLFFSIKVHGGAVPLFKKLTVKALQNGFTPSRYSRWLLK